MEHDLIVERHHGADALKGWNYQMAATARSAFELEATSSDHWTIQIEGIEDLDIWTIRQDASPQSVQYAQVKASSDGVDWTTMGQVLTSFVVDAQYNFDATFILITDHPLAGMPRRCAEFRHLDDAEQQDSLLHAITQRVRKNFQDQHRDPNSVTEDLVRHVLDGLDIDCIDDDKLTDIVVGLARKCYQLDDQAAMTYVRYVAGLLFEGAKKRQIFDHGCMDRWKLEFDLAVQSIAEMAAVQSHSVRTLAWKGDEQPDDFKEGRRTRTGHIFENLDVIRTKWIDEISRAFGRSSCVVVRGPSGQGKSTLAFRYMRDHWSDATVVEVVGAASTPDAEAIAEYVDRLQATKGNARVLIDNADDEKQFWPTVAARCQAMGIPVLVTTRTEDWRRLGRPDITGAVIVEPRLDGEEASKLFAQLQARGLVFDKEQTAEGAFEKVSDSGLLMEFIFYVTHGTMLTDRLEQQLNTIAAKPNAEKTLSLLLSVSLANILNCELERDALLGSDPEKRPLTGRLLNSLNGEYITVSENTVSGLHMVRSKHIVAASGENEAALATRALGLLPCVPQNEVSRLILHATECDMIDKQAFLDGLAAAIGGTGPSILSAALDALHDIGERHLVKTNKSVFDEAAQSAGIQSLDILTWFISPVDGSTQADNFEKTKIAKPNALFWSMKKLALGIDQSQRGADFCREMLRRLDSDGLVPLDPSDLAGSGRVLWWCGTLQFHPNDFTQLILRLLDSISLASVNVTALADLSTGLFTWDRDLHRQWMDRHVDEILRIFTKSTDCTRASLEQDELHVEFLTGLPGSSLSTEDAMDRLKIGRAVFPHCSKYCSRGIWIDVMTKGILSHDPTVLGIPVKNIPLEHDVWRNRSQARAIWSYFADDTDAKYLSSWTRLREAVLDQCKDIVDAIHKMLQMGTPRIEVLSMPAARIKEAIQDAPLVAPERLSDSSSSLLESLPESKWTQALLPFAECLGSVAAGQSNRIRILLQVAAQLVDRIRPMQESLESRALLDSRSLTELSAREAIAYRATLAALRTVLTDFPPTRVHSATSYVSESEERAVTRVLDQCQRLVRVCASRGVSVIPPKTVDINIETVIFPVGIKIVNMAKLWTEELNVVVDAMSSMEYDGGIWLLPLVNGATMNDLGYQVYASTVHEQLEEGLYQKPMLEVPASLRQTLPVPTGIEPVVATAALACLTGTSCLATLREAALGIDAHSKREIARQCTNSAPYVSATPLLVSAYRESLEQQLTRLHGRTNDVSDPELHLTEVMEYVSAVLAVLSKTTASMGYSALMEAVAGALGIARNIPMLSYLFVEEGTPEDQLKR